MTTFRAVPLLPVLCWLFAFLSVQSSAWGAQVTIGWDASTNAMVGGYSVYWGESSGNYTHVADAQKALQHTIAGLPAGKVYYFAVKAYDETGTRLTDYSQEVEANIPNLAPQRPGNASSDDAGSGSELPPDVEKGTETNKTARLRQKELDRALVAAYAFEESAGKKVNDHSGKNNHGVLRGPRRVAKGRSGRGLRFDGLDDIVLIPDSKKLQLGSEMTLEAWVSPINPSSGSQAILIKEEPSTLSYYLYANASGGTPLAGMTTDSAGSAIEVTGKNSLLPRKWAHLAATFDGAALRFYVNGIEAGNQAVSGNLLKSSGKLVVGGSKVWGDHFHGRIDEIRIYKRALTASEIQRDMNEQVLSEMIPAK